jgi:hypothetical protein
MSLVLLLRESERARESAQKGSGGGGGGREIDRVREITSERDK